MARGHELFRLVALVFCNFCGCRSAGSRARNLRLQCKGVPSGTAQAYRLTNLRESRHPDDPSGVLDYPRLRVTLGELADFAALVDACVEQPLPLPLAAESPSLAAHSLAAGGSFEVDLQAKVCRLLASASGDPAPNGCARV